MFRIIVNEALQAQIISTYGPVAAKSHPFPVVSVWMSGDNKYGFIELYSATLANVAMSLNGLQFGGVTLRIARPKTYTEQYNGISNIAGATGTLNPYPMGMMMPFSGV